MALDPTTAASGITSAYLDAASLNADGTPNLDEDGQPVPPAGNFPADWASAYDTYAAAGEVPGADNIGRSPSILQQFLAGLSGATSASAFASALADYWATVAVQPGDPAHGGVLVTDVTNDAASQASAFEAAITASLTSEESKPYFLAFVSNVQEMGAKAVTWQVTEQFSDGSTQTFDETIA